MRLMGIEAQIPRFGCFLYPVAIMDWYSRSVRSWELASTLEGSFCSTALTATDSLAPLQQRQIVISIDGSGRALDNVFIEWL